MFSQHPQGLYYQECECLEVRFLQSYDLTPGGMLDEPWPYMPHYMQASCWTT